MRKRGFDVSIVSILVCGLACLAWVGCQNQNASHTPSPSAPSPSSSAGHDSEHGHDHDHEAGLPTDWAAGLAEVEKHYQAIVAAYQDNQPEKAEEALHAVGHVLEHLPELGAKAGITGESLATLKSATKTMFDTFYALDTAIHEGKPADFDGVKQPLSEAMTQLKGLVVPMP